jgi:nucleotide-binding universal stress UspA family protein
MRFAWIVAFSAAVAVAGCAINREGASVSPDVDMSRLKTYYVVRFAPDDRGIQEVIAAVLRKRGLEASSGSEGDAPKDAQVIVTYQDKWTWDMTMYMIELKIYFREPETGRLLAMGTSRHTSLSRRSPEEMAAEVLANIFKGGVK